MQPVHSAAVLLLGLLLVLAQTPCSAWGEGDDLLHVSRALLQEPGYTGGLDNSTLPPGLRSDCEGKDEETRPKRCWLWDYIIFHRTMRAKPGARYLVWTCFGKERGQDNMYPDDCAGLGDRLRGMTFALRIAYSTERVLLIHQEVPASMETFFKPNVIDWRVSQDVDIPKFTTAMPHFVLGEEKVYPRSAEGWQALANGTIEALQDRVVTISTNWMMHRYAGRKGGELQHRHNDPLLYDIMGSLFRMSDAVMARTQETLQKMGIGKNEKYVAFHFRLGEFGGEKQAQTRHNLKATKKEVLEIAKKCAYKLFSDRHRASDMTQAPPKVVLITDQEAFRTRAVNGEFAPWLSPPIQPVHFSEPDRRYEQVERYDGNIEKHITSMVDFGVLVKSTCLIYTNSGFAVQANYIGGQSCVEYVDSCANIAGH